MTLTPSSVSLVSINLDRNTAELATFKVDDTNGNAGSYKLRYDVTMNARCGPINVISKGLSSGLPALWSAYTYQGDTDSQSFAKTYTVERDLKCQTRYFVTVNYEPAKPGELPDIVNPTTPNMSPIKATANPLARAPVFWWDRELTSKTSTVQGAGNYAILNGADDFYEDLVEHDYARSLLVVEFPVANNNAFIDLSRTYDHSVNLQAWTFKLLTYDPRTVHCREVSCSPMITEGDYRYYTVTMRFAFAPLGKTWDTQLPQMGHTYYTKKSDGTYEVDDGGYRKRTTVEFMVPLDVDGTRRPDGQPVLISSIRALREVDFNPLTQGLSWNAI